ncbi:efflux RND transporter periplasmic adaptor subunit [Spirulina subsalsa FACHB-351]|uniref:Efflux RND transporter periplasmic adaptor subunit n=1 Tax=Spirulina subsalsa FACHB-351 TaxID=234711 RepID=A0ABT3LAV3_9CYAN|nr:efflux RND transporter periplasmic adaptor subunit [Spirulina subsalsa]MCW6038628.1 efflux RND transporter periplasmic adaptor subunit [Spirulina subsalsa FACHB-351]
MNSTPSNSPSPRRFRVVPPQENRPSTPPPTTQESTPPPDQKPKENTQPKNKNFPTHWLIIGTILVGVGAVSQIRTNPSLAVDGLVEFNPDAYREVTMEISGKITELFVKHESPIEAGMPIAQIESEALEQETQDLQLRALDHQVNLENARSQIIFAQERLRQTQDNLEQVRSRVNQLQQEYNSLNSSSPPPEIQGYKIQIQNLQAQLESQRKDIEVHEELAEEGVVSRRNVQKLRDEASMIQARMGEPQAAIGSITRRIRTELEAKQDELTRLQSAYNTANQEYIEAQRLAQSRVPVQQQIEEQIQTKRQKQAEHSLLKAPISGLVIAPNWYQIQGKVLRSGDPVLALADREQLIVKMQVKQEDIHWVQPGAKVSLSPNEFGAEILEVTVDEKWEIYTKDEQLNRSTVPVIARITDPQRRLNPNSQVFATIHSGQSVPLYKVAKGEICSKFKVRKYMPNFCR